MSGDKTNRAALERALGKLLGFEEGEAEDLLEHLFSIESEEDLSEYLVQLLGSQTPEVVDFVENVSRFRNGKSIVPTASDDDTKVPAEEKTSDTAALDSFRALAVANTDTKPSKKEAGKNSSGKQQRNKSRVPPPKKTNTRKQSPPPSVAPASSVKNQKQHTAKKKSERSQTNHEQEKEAVVEKFHPSRGKAKIVCGCFGTRHKALTNCLYCGRISCEVEGYDFCPFCGFMVEAGIAGNGRAFEQKERLLRFDRDFARRTEVFDDQADYQGPANWMTDEEQKEAEENQQKHLESLKRPKQTLRLAI